MNDNRQTLSRWKRRNIECLNGCCLMILRAVSFSPKQFIWLFLLLLLTQQLYSQHKFDKFTYSAPGPATPAPSALTFDGSFENVDYMTGTLSAVIPLFEIKLGDLSLPITLTNTNHGYKVGSRPGIVGMNWDINIGGSIVRQLNGLPDEMPGTGNRNYQIPLAENCQKIGLLKDLSDGKKDGLWDVYHYSVPGQSGKFINEKVTIPYNPMIEVSRDWAQNNITIKDGNGAIYEFTPAQTRQFGKTKYYDIGKTIKWTGGIEEPGTRIFVNRAESDPEKHYNYTDLWQPYRITTATNPGEIKFAYTTFEPWVENDVNIVESASLEIPVEYKIPDYNTGETGQNVDEWFRADKYYVLREPSVSQTVNRVVYKKKLDAIVFPGGRILFEYRLQGEVYLIETIRQVTDPGGQTIKTYHFNYTGYPHFISEIIVSGEDESAGKDRYSYTFGYHGQEQGFPAFGSKGKDQWGFYNGADNNRSLLSVDDNLMLKMFRHIPINHTGQLYYGNSNYACRSYYEGYSSGFLGQPWLHDYRYESGNGWVSNHVQYISVPMANRSFSLAHASRGALSQVVLPTGGVINYYYEAHAYPYPANDGLVEMRAEQGGGIRIARIVKEENGTTQTRVFKYGNEDGRKRYGILENGIGEHAALPVNITPMTYERAWQGRIYQTFSPIIYSDPVNNLSLYNGSAVAYKYASEYFYDRNGKCQGKTVYTFDPPPSQAQADLFDYIGLDIGLLPGFFNSDRDMNLNGTFEPKSIAYYKGDNPSGVMQLLKETRFNYHKYQSPLNEHLVNLSAGVATIRSGDFEQRPYLMNIQIPYCNTELGGMVYLNGITIPVGEAPRPYLAECSFQQDPAIDKSDKAFPKKYYTCETTLDGYSFAWRSDSAVTVEYDYGTATPVKMTSKVQYEYDGNLLPSQTTTYTSNNTQSTHSISYYSPSGNTPLENKLRQYNIRSLQSWDHISQNPAEFIVRHYYSIEPATGLLMKDSVIKGVPEPKRLMRYDRYDSEGRLVQCTTEDGMMNAALWSSPNYQVAAVKNALYTDIAYSSFETGDNGSWNIVTTMTDDPAAPTGNRVAQLTGYISKIGLTGGKYIISYWGKGGQALVNNAAGEALRSSNGWTLYRHMVEAAPGGSVIVNGSGYIDELRIHPAGAQMTTYTHKPFGGITSATDSNLRTIYYEYDYLGRLIHIRDQDRNIIKKTTYHLSNSPYDP